jgi:putative Holliday junction resolvase
MDKLPKSGRLMALDIGLKRIGIATCDSTRFIATPRLIINRSNIQNDLTKIKQFAEENEVVGIVVGLPINYPETCEFIQKFSQNLNQFLEEKLPIVFWDETLSSFEAKEINRSPLSRKKTKFVDDIAASIILEHFLQS